AATLPKVAAGFFVGAHASGVLSRRPTGARIQARRRSADRLTQEKKTMGIEDWRIEINALDQELLRLLNQRAELALKVGESKRGAGRWVCDHTRERELLERLCSFNSGPLDDRAVVELFRPIIHESPRIQIKPTQPATEHQQFPNTD